MEDTWAWRDLPVLDAVVSQLDEVNETGGWPDLPDIAEATGLGDLEVAAALDGEYLDLLRTSGDLSGWFVTRVTSAARRTVGQWPTGESLIERLAGGSLRLRNGRRIRSGRGRSGQSPAGSRGWRRLSRSTWRRRCSSTVYRFKTITHRLSWGFIRLARLPGSTR
jgi:hypothetical protein